MINKEALAYHSVEYTIISNSFKTVVDVNLQAWKLYIQSLEKWPGSSFEVFKIRTLCLEH